MPRFHGGAWVSQEARNYWEPKFNDLNKWWLEFERLSVLHNRDAAFQFCNPVELAKLTEWCKNYGLYCTPIDFEDNAHRVVITRTIEKAFDFSDSWHKRRDEGVGELLGYPKCCISKFTKFWSAGFRDTCLNQAEFLESERVKIIDRAIPECNVLLRDVGIRPVYHLPCSFSCTATIELASDLRDIAINLGYKHKIDDIYHVLAWPAKFSSLHGIAEITTPVVKLRRNTDVDPFERSIEYRGNVYPKFGASGIKFPFVKKHTQMNFIKDIWTDNGFNRRSDMERAHEYILRLLSNNVDKNRSISLFDYGCGNGELLRRIKEAYPNVIPYGADNSPDKVIKARRTLPGAEIRLVDLKDLEFDQTYDIGLISENRFKEIQGLKEKMERFNKKLIVYTYDRSP